VSAEAIVGIASVGVVLLIAVLGFMWRNLVHQIAAVNAAAATAHARIESNIKEAVTGLTERIDAQAASIDKQRIELAERIDAQAATIDQQRIELAERIDAQAATIDQQRIELTERIDAQRAEFAAGIDKQRAEFTASIDKQTDRIVEVHRDLRGLGERVAKVEAARP
jgi:DNA anti-recombination protein RmuC